MTAEHASDWLWFGWYVSWWVAALWAKTPVARPERGGPLADRAIAAVGALLLFLTPVVRRPGGLWLVAPLWPDVPAVAWGLFVAIAAAFAFCWWARLHLGQLWSGLVTVKADHRVVDTGPYRLVRHPIYTGVIAAAFGLALVKATPVALVGAAALAVGFRLTARKEERFLRGRLGAAAYDAYSRSTPMLVPFMRRA